MAEIVKQEVCHLVAVGVNIRLQRLISLFISIYIRCSRTEHISFTVQVVKVITDINVHKMKLTDYTLAWNKVSYTPFTPKIVP